MKNLFLIVATLCLLVVITNCTTKDPSNNSDLDRKNPVSAIDAVVENGNNYNSTIDSVVSNVETAIDPEGTTEIINTLTTPYKNGGFSLTLPTPIDENLMILRDLKYLAETVTISNMNAKIAGLSGFKAYKSNTWAGYLGCYSDVDAETYSEAFYTYITQDCNITGSSTTTKSFENEEEGHINITFVANYNINFKTGWNKMFANLSMDLETRTITVNYSHTETDEVKWRFSTSENLFFKSIKINDLLDINNLNLNKR